MFLKLRQSGEISHNLVTLPPAKPSLLFLYYTKLDGWSQV